MIENDKEIFYVNMTIKELKDLNGKLHEEVSDLEEENKVLKSKYKTLLYSGIIILVLTIIIFVALV